MNVEYHDLIITVCLTHRAIMNDVNRDNRVLSLVSQTGLKSLLVTSLDQLGRCQKSLTEFLEVCAFICLPCLPVLTVLSVLCGQFIHVNL